MITEQAQQYYQDHIADHLYGPYSYSDLLALATCIIVYAALRHEGASLEAIMSRVQDLAAYSLATLPQDDTGGK